MSNPAGIDPEGIKTFYITLRISRIVLRIVGALGGLYSLSYLFHFANFLGGVSSGNADLALTSLVNIASSSDQANPTDPISGILGGVTVGLICMVGSILLGFPYRRLRAQLVAIEQAHVSDKN